MSYVIVLISLFFTSNPANDLLNKDPFARSEWCKNINLPESSKKIEKILFTPLSYNKIEIVRTYLEIKGKKLPSPSGWFSPPRDHIAINETRKNDEVSQTVLDLLLGVPNYSDQKKRRIFYFFIKRGCIIRKLISKKSVKSVSILFKAVFDKVTLIFRDEITRGLQNMGPVIVFNLLPWSQKRYNRKKQRDKYLKARYARYILGSSPAGNPRLALQSAPITMKFELMKLYANHFHAQAIEPLLLYSNHKDKKLRKVARKSLLQYFESKGRGAKIGIVKLPGGIEKKTVVALNARRQAYHAVKRLLEKVSHGDYDRTSKGKGLALQLFKKWDKNRNERWIKLFAKGYKEYLKEDYYKAAEIYKKVLNHNPDINNKQLMTPVFRKLAKLALIKGELDNVISLLRLIVQIKPSPIYRADLFYFLGLKEESQQDYDQALYWYRRAVNINPKHIWGLAAMKDLDPHKMVPVEHWQLSAFAGSVLSIIILGFILFSRKF
ncbi:MAG: tetratricopeptide repeat protein [Myxococcota bacterium]